MARSMPRSTRAWRRFRTRHSSAVV